MLDQDRLVTARFFTAARSKRRLDFSHFNPLSTNITKWPNTLKQFVGKLPTNCLSVFDHFVGLVLKELTFSNMLNVVILTH